MLVTYPPSVLGRAAERSPATMATAALVAVASRVQESYDPGADSAFELALTDLDAASPAEQRQLGDPLAVVAETEVVTRLGERLRAAPWQSMGGFMDPVHSADPAAEPHASAMLNLSALFRCLRERLNCASDMARLREDRAATDRFLKQVRCVRRPTVSQCRLCTAGTVSWSTTSRAQLGLGRRGWGHSQHSMGTPSRRRQHVRH